MKEQDQGDPGFQFTLKLLLLSGILFLFLIITLNKLLNWYFLSDPDTNNLVLKQIRNLEGDSFQISNTLELLSCWAGMLLSLTGFVLVMIKLIKTWKH